ncbi:MAG: tRNA (guanosine(37)-N1)-methyltransferase TrmD [Patescibacteria group bacterium]
MTSRIKLGRLNFHLITLFPELIRPYLAESIVARAIRRKIINVSIHDLRDYGGEHYRIDDRPYGGGPGMVIRAEPVIRAVLAIKSKKPARVVILSPAGKEFTNKLAERWAKQDRPLILIAGRYEGIDARVKKILKAEPARATVEEISVGPYTVTGGELPALIIIDAVTRRLPGVLGDDLSVEEKRVASHEVYTRPEVITHRRRHYRVPSVLLSGHHKKINDWNLTRSGCRGW